MKRFSLSREQLALAAVAKNAETRQHRTGALTGVHITPTYAQASNGSIAVRVNHITQADGDLPHEYPESAILPHGPIADVAKVSRRYPGVDVSLDEKGAVTASAGQHTVAMQASDDTFPDVDAVLPNAPPAYRIVLGYNALVLMLDTMREIVGDKGHSDTPLIFEFRGYNDPVLITPMRGGHALGLLMPYKPHEPSEMGLRPQPEHKNEGEQS